MPFMKLLRLLRYIWALPNSIIGLLLLPLSLASGGEAHIVGGVLEISGTAVARALALIPFCGSAEALTLGHVVLAGSEEIMDRWRSHERMHVLQYELWGPFFIPAYFWSSLVARMKGKDGYLGNRFEAEAFLRQRDIT